MRYWFVLILLLPIVSHAWFFEENNENFTVKKFPLKQLTVEKQSTTNVYWVDNDSVVLSVPKNLGKPEQQSRVIFYNTTTDVVAETEYPGEVRCIHGGKLLTQREKISKSEVTPLDYFEVDLVGKKFQPIVYPNGKLLATWLCDFFQYVVKDQDGGKYFEVPLSNGRKIVHSFYFDKRKSRSLIIQQPDGARNSTLIGDAYSFSPVDFQYCGWNGAIHIGAFTDVSSLTIYEDGGVDVVRPPSFLRDLALTRAAPGYSRAVRDGIIWIQYGRGDLWKNQGVYFQRKNESLILKIDDGHWTGSDLLSISPDGCKVIGLRSEGNPFRNLRYKISVLNTCWVQK